MAEDLKNSHGMDLLPVWQRIAWMAVIWTLSVGAMAMVTVAVGALIS